MVKDGFGLILYDVIGFGEEGVVELMHGLLICHDPEVGLDAPELAIKLNNTVRVFCINCCPILRMIVVDLENGRGVFKKCLEFLVCVILGVLFNVERFSLTELVDEREFTSDLVSIAYQFSRELFDQGQNVFDLGSVVAHFAQEVKDKFLSKNGIYIDVSFLVATDKASQIFVLIKIAIGEKCLNEVDKASVRIRLVVHFEILVFCQFLFLWFVLVLWSAETHQRYDLGFKLHG